jgi:solute carrier family 41
MILSTGMASASISGLILGSFMCSLILICRRFRLNPGAHAWQHVPIAFHLPSLKDNIAPPVASCLGDLLTLCILGLTSAVFIRTIDTVLPVLVIIMLAIGAVAAIMLTLRNEYVRQLIFSGWTPLLGAMLISSGTGLVLDHFVNRYEGFGLFAVVISGGPGTGSPCSIC